MVTATKHRTVAQVLAFHHEDYVRLVQGDDDDPRFTIQVGSMAVPDWLELGSPAEVTVTFEPGNVLEE